MLTQKKTVFVGADIVTLSEQLPRAEAVCVAGGRIECVGSKEDVLHYASQGDYTVHDLGGGWLYPGFIDTHSHLSSYSNCLNQVYCGADLGSIAAVKKALGEWAARNPEGWIVGYGFDDSGIPDNRHMDRHDLDEVSQDRPVFVIHISVHMGYVNTKGLELLGYTADTIIPGGKIVLDDKNCPTGFLLENALLDGLGKLPSYSNEEIRNNLASAIREYNARGFTTIQDGGLGIYGDSSAFLSAYMELARSGKLNARMYLQLLPQELDPLLKKGLWGIGTDHLKIGGVKFFADGSIQGYTGALLEDYYSRPGYKGSLIWDADEIAELIFKYHSMGLQVAVHANGDAAIEAVTRGFEKAQARSPRPDAHHMIIHVQTASDSQLERLKKVGVLPTLFARHVEVWGDRHRTIYLGPDRADRLDPAGSCARMGIPFALHVDTPVLPVTALQSMHAAVNRVSSGGVLLGDDQRITPRQALEAYTSNAALFCDGEHDRGRIEPGRFADFVLLDEDMDRVEPTKVSQIKVCKTICGGDVVYEA